MRSCARRALFSRPSSATGNPGGGLHRGLPGPVRGRADLPGAAPDRLWVVDFTFVPTWAGTAYTALVIDAFSRLIAGWRTAASHGTDLVLDALVMAVTYRARQGVKVAGLIHHSDAGSEYLSIRYGAELAAAGIAPSVGSVGDSYDNALAESIVGLYKAEVIGHLGPWEPPAQVEAATSEWASWYNTARVMRRTGGRPPAEYEQAWRDGTLGQVPARGPGSRPRRPAGGGGDGRRSLPGRAPPAPAGAPPRAPALLRDGPAGQDGCGGGPGEARPISGGHLDSAAGQMFDKQKRQNDQTVVPPGGGTVEDNGHPDQSIWGESSLHQTRGAPVRGRRAGRPGGGAAGGAAGRDAAGDRAGGGAGGGAGRGPV